MSEESVLCAVLSEHLFLLIICCSSVRVSSAVCADDDDEWMNELCDCSLPWGIFAFFKRKQERFCGSCFSFCLPLQWFEILVKLSLTKNYRGLKTFNIRDTEIKPMWQLHSYKQSIYKWWNKKDEHQIHFYVKVPWRAAFGGFNEGPLSSNSAPQWAFLQTCLQL